MGKACKHSASKGGKSKQQSIIEHALPLLKKQMEMVGKQVNIPCSWPIEPRYNHHLRYLLLNCICIAPRQVLAIVRSVRCDI